MTRPFRPCSIPGCESPRHGARWCHKHLTRFKKHGDPTYDHWAESRAARDKVLCSIEGCGRRMLARGYCRMHLQRIYVHGDPHKVRVPAFRFVAKGYVRVKLAGHPLADRLGWVLEHRAVLFDAIGPGEHPCHHCGKPVDWAKRYPRDADALVVDHLNHDRADNRLDNLVPSCAGCNGARDRERDELGHYQGVATAALDLPDW